MPGTVIARSLLNEPRCILDLKANEIDGTRTELFAQELLDVPCVVDHGRVRQPLVVLGLVAAAPNESKAQGFSITFGGGPGYYGPYYGGYSYYPGYYYYPRPYYYRPCYYYYRNYHYIYPYHRYYRWHRWHRWHDDD